MEKCIAMCVQEEERIKIQHGGLINHAQNKKKKAFHVGCSSQAKYKGPMQQNYHPKNFLVDKDQCLHCKQKGHYKECLLKGLNGK